MPVLTVRTLIEHQSKVSELSDKSSLHIYQTLPNQSFYYFKALVKCFDALTCQEFFLIDAGIACDISVNVPNTSTGIDSGDDHINIRYDDKGKVLMKFIEEPGQFTWFEQILHTKKSHQEIDEFIALHQDREPLSWAFQARNGLRHKTRVLVGMTD